MSKIKKIIHDNEEKYIRFLAKLVAFDTSVIRHGEDGQEAKAQEWLAKYLENLGCEIEMFEPDNEKLNVGGARSGFRFVVIHFFSSSSREYIIFTIFSMALSPNPFRLA